MHPFAYTLGQAVTLSQSGETGSVIGRAEYVHDEPKYLVRYLAGDGRQVKDWIAQSALLAA